MLALACCIGTGCCPSSPFPARVSVRSQGGRRRCPWAKDHEHSVAVPPFPSDIAHLFRRDVKVLCESLWCPLKAAACPGTVQRRPALPLNSAHTSALPCRGCHALIPALCQTLHPSPCSKAFPSVHLGQTVFRQTRQAGLAAWQSRERHCRPYRAPL